MAAVSDPIRICHLVITSCHKHVHSRQATLLTQSDTVCLNLSESGKLYDDITSIYTLPGSRNVEHLIETAEKISLNVESARSPNGDLKFSIRHS